MMNDEDKEAMKELVTVFTTNSVELPEGDTRDEFFRDWQHEVEWDWREAGILSDWAGWYAATLESLVHEMIGTLIRRDTN